MASEASPPPTPTATSNRRTSVSRQTLADLFGRSPPATGGTPAFPGPIVTAAANAQAQQRRRSSITQALSGSPTSSSFSLYGKGGSSSYGSNNSPSGSIEESAVEDGDAPGPPPGSSPTSPFVRRVSFGARALKDARAGAGLTNGNNGEPFATLPYTFDSVFFICLTLSYVTHRQLYQWLTPASHYVGEGFDWSEHNKNRAARSASLTQRPAPVTSAPAPPANAPRANSTAVPEQPAKEKKPKQLDDLQERILKGDFVMS